MARDSPMPHALLILVALLLSANVGVRADEPAAADEKSPSDAELRSRVERLVTALEATRRSRRREAEESLIALGPDVLPLLPPIERLETAALRETMRRIRGELELEAARRSLRASTVTLKGRLPLGDVLAEVAKQSGNRLDTSQLPERRLDEAIDVSFSDTAFWACIDHVLTATNLDLDTRDEDVLAFVESDESEPRPTTQVTYYEAFRVELVSVRRRSLFGDDEHDSLRVTLAILAEPRLRPLFARYRGDSLVVRLDAETTLPALNPEATLEPPVTTGRIVPRWDFRIPTGTRPESVSLSGAVVLTIAAGRETFRFPTLDETGNVERRRGGVAVRTGRAVFEDDPAGGRRAEVDVVVAYDTGGPAFESHRTWVYENVAGLETADGTTIEPAEPPMATLGNDGAVALRFRFRGLKGEPSDYRFVYEAPTLIVNAPVRFEWGDVEVEGERTIDGESPSR